MIELSDQEIQEKIEHVVHASQHTNATQFTNGRSVDADATPTPHLSIQHATETGSHSSKHGSIKTNKTITTLSQFMYIG